jgi:predicted enzyme related to lactoylglutathione lyase
MEAFRSALGRVCLRLDFCRWLPRPFFDFTPKTNRREVMSEGNKSDRNHQINYIEFTTTDIKRARQFYAQAFGWSFEDWGPDYISFSAKGAGIDGGFRSGEAAIGSPLVVLYSTDLVATGEAVIAAQGTITVPTYEFPGGRRFHFSDGAGNELAVWSE